MKRLSQYFVRGLLSFLPFGLTLYFLYLFLAWSEGFTRELIKFFIGDYYLPGMGLILAASGIVFLGFIVSQKFMENIFSFVEMPFNNVPVVKSIYSAIKSFADYFSPSADGPAQHVVLVKWPGSEIELVGFLTNNDLKNLPHGVSKDKRVAVYLPMGYMIGGYTVFIPSSWITRIDMSVEDAMKQILVAWMPQKKRYDYGSDTINKV